MPCFLIRLAPLPDPLLLTRLVLLPDPWFLPRLVLLPDSWYPPLTGHVPVLRFLTDWFCCLFHSILSRLVLHMFCGFLTRLFWYLFHSILARLVLYLFYGFFTRLVLLSVPFRSILPPDWFCALFHKLSSPDWFCSFSVFSSLDLLCYLFHRILTRQVLVMFCVSSPDWSCYLF